MNITPALRLPALCLAAMLGMAGSSVGQSPSADPVIAVVNGTEIRESELQLADETIGRNLPTQDKTERRAAILKMLIDSILLSNVAKDRKIADEADLQRRITYARNQGLMQQLLSRTGEQAMTEDAIRRAYEEVVVKAAEPELNLRHMFFKIADPKDEAAVNAAEDKAKAALARINNGEDFAAVVADVSEDPATRETGGDFGWRVRGQMGKEYADVAFGLKNGEASPLIKTAFGWHIIKREDQRIRKPVEFEKIRERVAVMVARAAQFELIEKVRAEAKIVHMDASNPADKGAQSGK